MLKLSLVPMVLALGMSAWAAPVIDQNQPASTDAISSLGQSLFQTFTAGSGNVSGAGIFVGDNPFNGLGGTAATLEITLWSGAPNSGGVALASASGVAQPGAGSWFEVFFEPVPVVAGDGYFLSFGGGAGSNLVIFGSLANPYAGGQVFAGDSFTSFPTYDYAFRTYFDDGTTPAVPELSSFAMASVGLLLLGASLRRRRPG